MDFFTLQVVIGHLDLHSDHNNRSPDFHSKYNNRPPLFMFFSQALDFLGYALNEILGNALHICALTM